PVEAEQQASKPLRLYVYRDSQGSSGSSALQYVDIDINGNLACSGHESGSWTRGQNWGDAAGGGASLSSQSSGASQCYGVGENNSAQCSWQTTWPASSWP